MSPSKRPRGVELAPTEVAPCSRRHRREEQREAAAVLTSSPPLRTPARHGRRRHHDHRRARVRRPRHVRVHERRRLRRRRPGRQVLGVSAVRGRERLRHEVRARGGAAAAAVRRARVGRVGVRVVERERGAPAVGGDGPADAPPDVRAAARRVVGARFAQRRRQLARRRVRDADARRVAHDLRARRALHRERLRHVGRRPLRRGVRVHRARGAGVLGRRVGAERLGGRRRHHAVRRSARAARVGRARRRRAEHAAGRRREGAREGDAERSRGDVGAHRCRSAGGHNVRGRRAERGRHRRRGRRRRHAQGAARRRRREARRRRCRRRRRRCRRRSPAGRLQPTCRARSRRPTRLTLSSPDS